MDLLKRQAFVIICVVVAGGGIALMITGVRAMPQVGKEMEKVATIHHNLSRLQPVSMDSIEAAQQRIDSVVKDHDRVFNKAGELYGYELLVPGSLPDGDSIRRAGFRKRYNEAMNKLMQSLKYGTPATVADMAMWADRIEEEQAALVEFGAGVGSAPKEIFTGPERSPAGVLTKAGVQSNRMPRAHLWAAQRIFLYAAHFNEVRGAQVASLDFWLAMKDSGVVNAPDIWDIWHAQYGYWVQKDVVDAIASVNGAAADALRKQGEHPWVGNLPVKEVISVRVSGSFVPRDGDDIFGARAGGYEEALPPGTPTTTFTGNVSDELHDVVQFTLKLIMDQRDVPALIDALTRESFHTLLRVSYEAVPLNRDMQGKIYGSEPAVNVVMDLETVLLGSVFRRWMPPVVIDEYGVTCRPEDECYSFEGEE